MARPPWRILVTAPYLRAELDRYRGLLGGEEVVLPPLRERLSEEELLPWVGDVDGAICGDDAWTDRVIAAAPRLRVLSKWGTGIDSIDLEACRRRGVAVRNVPDAFTDAVADSAVGYVLAFARRIVEADRAMHAGRWEKAPGLALSECVVGIVGVGRIGRAVARRLAAFGARVLGTDPVAPPADVVRETKIEMRSLDDLLEAADFVTLHCDLNPTSRGLVSAAALGRMKPTAVLVNTARGPVVDEAALARALEGGRLAGAALDVFEEEPLPAGSPLRRMANVLLAPHNANGSRAARDRVQRLSIAQALDGLREAAPGGRP